MEAGICSPLPTMTCGTGWRFDSCHPVAPASTVLSHSQRGACPSLCSPPAGHAVLSPRTSPEWAGKRQAGSGSLDRWKNSLQWL